MVVKAGNQIEGIGYIRQSVEREDKEDISEQTQLTKIQGYCDFNNIKLVKVFKDIDYSGFRISYTKRPGIMDSLKYAQEHPSVKKFIIFNLSRLTRRKKDFQLIQNSLTSLQVDICSASEQLDFGSATGRLVTSILVDFNEYYSDNLSDVTNDNKKTNAEKGRWNGGPAPYGLKKENDGFIADGEKAITIENIFALAKEGKGPYRISNWLQERKIMTETGVDWSPRRVRYVLNNPTYAAMQKWKGKYYPLSNSVALVKWEEDFLYIQSTLFGTDKVWRGKERQLLSSILKCPECGSRMHARYSTNKTIRKYVCSLKNSTGQCKSANFELSSLNNAVIELIGDMAKKQYGPEDILPEISDDPNKGISSIRKLQEELSVLEEAKQKVFDDYYLNSKFSEDQFNALMIRYDKRQKEVSNLLEKIPLPHSKNFGSFDDVIEQFSEAIKVLSDEDKRRSIELIVEEITAGVPTLVHFKWGETKEIHPVEVKKYKQKLIMF